MDPTKTENPSSINNECGKVGALDGNHQVSMSRNEENEEQNVHNDMQVSIDETQNNNNSGCIQEKDTTGADNNVHNKEYKDVKENIHRDDNSNDQNKAVPPDVQYS